MSEKKAASMVVSVELVLVLRMLRDLLQQHSVSQNSFPTLLLPVPSVTKYLKSVFFACDSFSWQAEICLSSPVLACLLILVEFHLATVSVHYYDGTRFFQRTYNRLIWLSLLSSMIAHETKTLECFVCLFVFVALCIKLAKSQGLQLHTEHKYVWRNMYANALSLVVVSSSIFYKNLFVSVSILHNAKIIIFIFLLYLVFAS